MDLVYMDYNCFQRGFDDPRQVRIRMEALASQEILGQRKAKSDWFGLSCMRMKRSSVPFRNENTKSLALLLFVKYG